MAEYKISNGEIQIVVDSMGAELKTLVSVKTKEEYLWDANPAYWKRTSPVLFPFVGGVKNGEYRYENVSYPMTQHGFARDMEFSLKEHTENSLFFTLHDTEDTLKKYPFSFELEIGYTLKDKSVEVSWKVTNENHKTMYFSIGAHPAFVCPALAKGEPVRGSILLKKGETPLQEAKISLLSEKGLIIEKTEKKALEAGKISISEHLFDGDALVLEHFQADSVTLLTPENQPYLKVSFQAPLFGIWSPPFKNAPFLCIEPWYGRCDRESFTGSLEEREWGNTLEAGETFKTAYQIEIL